MRGHGSIRKRALCGAAALTLCVAAPALAGLELDTETSGPVTYVTAEISAGGVPEGEDRTLIAGCPAGTKLAGLGGSFRGGGAGAETILNAVQPADGGDANGRSDDAVRVRGIAVSGPGNIRAQAACTDARPKTASDPEPFPPEQGKTISVPCPKGTYVTGGGGQASGEPEDARLHSTSPYDDGDAGSRPDDGWRVRAFNLTEDPLQLTAYAICAEESPRYQEQEYEIVSDGIALGTSACSKGRALSVGAKTDAPAADARLIAVELADSSEINGGDADTAPDDFAGVVVLTEPDGTKKLTVTLICGP